jgi:hypothetical protein
MRNEGEEKVGGISGKRLVLFFKQKFRVAFLSKTTLTQTTLNPFLFVVQTWSKNITFFINHFYLQ